MTDNSFKFLANVDFALLIFYFQFFKKFLEEPFFWCECKSKFDCWRNFGSQRCQLLNCTSFSIKSKTDILKNCSWFKNSVFTFQIISKYRRRQKVLLVILTGTKTKYIYFRFCFHNILFSFFIKISTLEVFGGKILVRVFAFTFKFSSNHSTKSISVILWIF